MTVSRAEEAITVAWTEILYMCDDDDAAAVRALGALCLGSRSLSGLCWDEKRATEADWTDTGEMTAQFVRAEYMREVVEDYLARADGGVGGMGAAGDRTRNLGGAVRRSEHVPGHVEPAVGMVG